jgi:hypothetical protein
LLDNYLTLVEKNVFVFIIINFLQMATGFELERIPDDETPTWCLEEERTLLLRSGNLNQVDATRLAHLNTLLAIRSEMRS